MEAAALNPRRSVLLLKVIGVAGALMVLVPIILILGGVIVQQFHAPVHAESLNVSVGIAAGSSFVGSGLGECREADDGRWTCEVSDQGGSGSYVYAVDVKPDSSCWDAKLLKDYGEAPAPKQLSSCVNRFQEGWWGVLGV